MAKYGQKSKDKVGKALHEEKHGELKSGQSGRTVKSRKQAIAIGLSEARKAGGKVPPKKGAAKKGASKKSAAKKKSPAKRRAAAPARKKSASARKKAASAPRKKAAPGSARKKAAPRKKSARKR